MKLHQTLKTLTVIALGTAAATATAQPAPEPNPNPTAGSGAPAAGSASEPVFEPEHITSKPQPAPTNEPITVDRIVIASTARIDLNFFGDVSFEKLTDAKPAFVMGPLVLQIVAHLAEGLAGRTEMQLSYQDNQTIVDVERIYLEYRTSQWMLAAGRTHTELGYWNNAFHHGRWLQLTINRPHVLRFEDEGGMLQVHQVGLTALYGPPRGDSGLEVALGVGNGHGRTIDTIQTESDNNLGKSALVRIGAVGIGHPALRFGVNAGVDFIAPEDAATRPLLPNKSMFEVLTGAYVALRGDRLIIFSEIYNVYHRASDTWWQITDGFAVAGYRFGPYIPYAQLEVRYGDGAFDPFYNPNAMTYPEATPPRNFVEGIGGLKYDVNTWSALKLELSYGSFADAAAKNQSDYRAELNWSFGR